MFRRDGSVVERIRALNPKLNAIVTDLTDQALAEAAAADRAFKQSPEAWTAVRRSRSPLR